MFFMRFLLVLTWSLAVHCSLDIHIQENTKNAIPSPADAACMARYVVHNSNWCSLAYISQNKSTFGTPLARVFSISDGIPGNSSGTVYMMVSPLDLTVKDLLVKNNCSIIVSLAEINFCTVKKYDAQDPRCAQAVLNGNFVEVPKNTEEYNFAKKVLWERHPIMKFWFHAVPGTYRCSSEGYEPSSGINGHKWFFAKIQINQIEVVDTFGGRKFPSVDDYYHKKCDSYLRNEGTDFTAISNLKIQQN